jgi:hypothetical protein
VDHLVSEAFFGVRRRGAVRRRGWNIRFGRVIFGRRGVLGAGAGVSHQIFGKSEFILIKGLVFAANPLGAREI